METKRRIMLGGLAGIIGGVVFGMMMGMMGMLTMIGEMVGKPSAVVGFAVHLMNSAVIGAVFGFLFGSSITVARIGLIKGAIYGMVWWFIGPLTLMPLMMGKGTNWSMEAAGQMLPSLMGHLIYGMILGAAFWRLMKKSTGL